ncbi:Reverse transcriptase zinc-binding domain [Macleaya cordata]|uniref:Reverse transcriptase zinc-binding domain n=1 Tax=Macleaya cordata TaxID=56857 RepID=A0A200QJL5_MACCD|nr:Reverse transcriptase zinc-binding domain [Macleaya cordata]
MEVSLSGDMDRPWWGNDGKGDFSVSKCYKGWEVDRGDEYPEKLIWSHNWPQKVSFFLWLLSHEKMLTIDMLKKKGWSIPNRCYLYNCEEETIRHLMFHCKVSYEVWQYFTSAVNWYWVMPNSILTILHGWKRRGMSERGKILWKVLPASICWSLWKSRNAVAFDSKGVNVDRLILEVKIQAFFWVQGANSFNGIFLDNVIGQWKDMFY